MVSAAAGEGGGGGSMITKENADRLIKFSDEINGIMSLEDFHNPNFDEDDVPDTTRTVFVISTTGEYDSLFLVGYGCYDQGVWYSEDGENEIVIYGWCDIAPMLEVEA